mmetsp:Transcript_38282/g.71787  ORF Transcript_38282/g.71787 Transcript_38282/m.71787 type:complete len:102 (-) Transcript_38282:272-577(-)
MPFCPPGEKEKNTFEFEENLHSKKKKHRIHVTMKIPTTPQSRRHIQRPNCTHHFPTLFHCLDAKVEVGNQKECILKKKKTPVEKTAFLEQGIRNCSVHQKE